MKYHFNENLRSITRVRAGTPERLTSSALFLDRNERAAPYPPEVLDALAARLARSRPNQYPELQPFYDKVAAWAGLAPNQLFITDGVSGAIKALLEALAPSGANIVFPSPTFALYPVYARMFGIEPRAIGYDDEFQVNINALEATVDDDTAFVFIPNPNVPIEGYLPLETISRLAVHCARFNAALVVDEVYYLFGGETAKDLIEDHSNLFIMRSFSKGFGLPGVRVGFVAGPADIIEFVARTRTGYETSTLSAEAVSFFLENINVINSYVEQVKEGLEQLKRSLDSIGILHNGGVTGNFIYLDLGSRAAVEAVVATLREQDIHIRGGWPRPFDGGVAVTGAPPEQMSRFFDAFKTAVARHGIAKTA
jgi:histidinol-phosphate aminotransferase